MIEFSQLPALQQVTKDGGRGLAGGVKRVNAARRRQQRPAVLEQDDHFHVLREGRRALRATESAARRALDKAVWQERRGRRRPWGRRATKAHACAVAYYWRVAERAFDVDPAVDQLMRLRSPTAARTDALCFTLCLPSQHERSPSQLGVRS